MPEGLSPSQLKETVEQKERRKIRARKEKREGILFGMGMFGLVGWSVAIPSVLMIALGIWLDRKWPQGFSWTLTFLFLGVILGCMNAWFWVKRESHLEDPLEVKHKDS